MFGSLVHCVSNFGDVSNFGGDDLPDEFPKVILNAR